MKKYTFLGKYIRLLILCMGFFWAHNGLFAQVRLRVTVNSGNSGTSCTDGFLGGAPDPQWRVNIDNNGWTTYPRSGACFTNPANVQYDVTYDCPSGYPTQIQVCFRAFEDDPNFPCVVNEDCSETICQNFPVPAVGGANGTYTLTIPNNGTNRSWGSMNFTISSTGSFTLPGAANDAVCNAINLGTMPAGGGTLGNNSLSNYGNYCATNTGDPNPSNWNNEQGVWFRFTTGANPGAVIDFEAANDPAGRGDQIDLEIALYSSSNGTCSGTLTRIQSEHEIPLYDEDMSVNCLQPNTTYFILVDGNDNGIFGGQEGFFGLQVVDNGVLQAGDRICQAEHLGTVPPFASIGTPALSRSNVCATNTADPTPGTWSSEKTVWFSFNAPPSGNVIIETNSDLPAPFGTDAIDLQVALYSTNNNLCTGTLTFVQGSYSPIGFDEDMNVRCLDPGRRYWILVDGSGLNVDGIFDIRVRDGGIPPAPNDRICNFIPLGQPLPGGTVGLINQNNFCADNIFEPIPQNWGNDQGVWYTFVAPPSGKVEIRTQSEDIFGDPIDLQIAVYDSDNMTCSGNLTHIKSEHEGIGLLWDEDMEVECLIPGRTYFILIDGEGSLINPGLQEGIFDIQVYGDPRDPPSPYDQICNARALGNPTAAPVGTTRGAVHGSQNNFCATSAGEPTPSGFTPRQTVWYSFVAPATGNVNINLISDPILNGTDPIDISIAVWESSNNLCTGTLREELSGDDLLYDASVDVYCLEPGRTYFVQVDGSGAPILGGREGYFDITISQLPPIPVAPNNNICNAVALGNPFATGSVSIANQHNLCADNIGDPTPSAFSPDQTVWYTFTTPIGGTTYAVDVEATSSLPWPFGSQNSIDLQIAVYQSSNNTCTGTLTEVDSDYDIGFFDESVQVQCLLPNTTYFVMIDGSALDVQGYFDLEISAATSVPIPTNDDICQHTDLGAVPVGGTINNGTNYFNFCADTEPGEPSPFTIDQTVWFSFVAPNHTGANATANVTVRVNSDPNNLGNDIDLQLAVYESSNNTCSGSLNRLDDADPLFSANSSVSLTCLYPGRRYWVQVDGSLLDVDGYFTIRVEDDGAGIRPTNNNICNAVALGQVPNGGSVGGNGTDYLNLCSDVQAGEPSPSFGIEQTVWFTFQAPASGNLTINLRNDPNNRGDQIDLQMALYQAANNNCNGAYILIDDSYNPFGYSESLSLQCLVPGGLYYLQVDGASGTIGGQEGYFTIQVSDDGGTSNFPYNNEICNARNFGTPSGTQQVLSNETTECANVQFSEPGVGNYAGHTVWYQFTAPASARVRIEVQSNNLLFGLDPEVYVFASSNNSCTGAFNRVESSNLPTSLITEVIEATCLIPGQTYFIQVDGSGLNEEDDFTIRIRDMRPNYGTGLAGDVQPANNDCSNPAPLIVQSQSCMNGNGTFQTFNYGEPTISYNNGFVQNCNRNCGDTWYTFTMPSSGIARIEASDDNIGGGVPFGDFSEATVATYTGSCNNLVPINCDAGGLTSDVAYEVVAAPGSVVYVQVFNDAGDDDDEDFQLCVSEGCGADHCLNAVAVPIQPNIPYCFNTAGATGENISGGAAGYNECGENDNPEHSIYYYFVSDCNGSGVTINIINAFCAGGCILGTTPSDGFNVSLFQDATPCDNNPQALVDCQNFNGCMVQPINWSQTYNNLVPNTPYIIQIDGGFNFLGGNNNGQIMIQTTTNPVLTPTATPVTCGGTNDGTATATVVGGVPPYTFVWSVAGRTDSVLTGLAAGTYYVTATGANGCVDSATVIVPAPQNSISIAVASTQAQSCAGVCDGQAAVSGVGGIITTGYLYQWSASANNQTTSNATGLCAGTYTVTVRDNSTCFAITTVNISAPAAVSLSVQSFANATCAGCDGSANLSATGGTVTTGYRYIWSNGNTSANPTGLCAGAYTITVTDNNNCSATTNLSITQPVSISASIASLVNPACAGGTGSVQINPSNGLAPYSYNLSGVTQSANSFSNLSAGNYNVTVADANGCRTFVPFTITQPSALSATLASTIDVSCNGAQDGELIAQATANSGTAPYQYSLNGVVFQNSGQFTNLNAGNYTITVRDANNCTTSLPATLSEPAGLSVSTLSQTVAGCGVCNASAQISVTGGSLPYDFIWSNGNSTANPNNLCAGANLVTITDNNGCTIVSNLSITNSSGLNAAISISQPISCFGDCNGVLTNAINGGTAPYSVIWSTGATTSNLTGVCAGIYANTITDANGCFSVNNISVSQPAQLNLSAAQTQPVACAGGNNGQATALATGGTGAYEFIWSNGQTNTLATGLSAGTHTVTATDNNGCSATSSVSISQPAGMSIQTSVVAPSACVTTACDGQASVSVTNGTAPYAFIWTGGSTTNLANNLCPNLNMITVTDANGCMATAVVNIPSNSTLLAGIVNQSNPSCFGDCNGSANITVSGGNTSQPYRFIWSNGRTTSALTGVCAGVYSVTVSDIDACSNALVVTISQPSQISVSTQAATNYNGTNVSCAGAADANIQSLVSGGTTGASGYTFLWSNGQTSQNLSGVAAGAYAVTATDANNCRASNTITLSSPSVLTFTGLVTTNFNGTNVSCAGATDASASLSITGGVAAYTYRLSNNTTGTLPAVLNNLGAGAYPITATDANGCTSLRTLTVTAPAAISATAFVSTNFSGFGISCHGAADGVIGVNMQGGAAPYQYLWSNGGTTQNISGLSENRYFVTVTDANGCSDTSTIMITPPPALAVRVTNANFPLCFGTNTGDATVTYIGGIGNINYIWSNGQTSATATGLGVGNYRVTVTDANNCSAITTVLISQPGAISASISVTNVLCAGTATGTATTTPSGGTAPIGGLNAWGYLWSNGQTNRSATGLAAGSYALTITDANGCNFVTNATINQPQPIVINTQVSSAISCFGYADGQLSASVSGGISPYTYLWSNGQTSQTMTNASTGNYSVTVTDANNCTSISTVSISQPAAFGVLTNVISNYNGAQITCRGAATGVITAIPNGGTAPYNYLWTTGQTSQVITGITAGIYTVIMTDAGGCRATDSVQIRQPGRLEIGLPVRYVTCFGYSDGSITASVASGTPPYTYLWSNNQVSQIIGNLPANTYGVTITDANGCSDWRLATIQEPTAISSLGITSSPAGCAAVADGQAQILGVIGGTPFVFAGNAYYNYLWDNGETNSTANRLNAGLHQVTISDSRGCSFVETVSIGALPNMSISFANVSNINCANFRDGQAAVVVMNGTPGYTFLWDNGFIDSVETRLHIGYNLVTVTDSRGCTQVDSVFISSPSTFTASIASTDISCYGLNNGTASVSASGGVLPYAYAWSDGQSSSTATGMLPNSLYWVTVTDANGCSQLLSAYLRQPTEFVASISEASSPSCSTVSDGSIRIFVMGGQPTYNFVWSNGLTHTNQLFDQLANLNAGAYRVTVTDANGCVVILDTILSLPTGIFASASVTPTLCANSNDGKFRINASGGRTPYTYVLDNQSPSNNPLFTGVSSGLHTIAVLDSNGCAYTLTLTVPSPDSTLLVTPADMQIQFGDAVNLYVRMPINAPINTRISWSPAEGLSCTDCTQPVARPFVTTNYIVTVVGDDNCPSRSDVLVEVDEKRNVFIPNSFSPNGDGINDIFFAFSRDNIARVQKCMVFDRWGEMVHLSQNHPTNASGYGWDGTFKGKTLNSGVFVYYIELKFIDGRVEIFKGDVTLIR